MGIFFCNFFFAAASFSLNNDICLFACLFVCFFSDYFQIIQWSLLDQKHLHFHEMTFQCTFSMYCNKGKHFFPFFFFYLFLFCKILFWNKSLFPILSMKILKYALVLKNAFLDFIIEQATFKTRKLFLLQLLYISLDVYLLSLYM